MPKLQTIEIRRLGPGDERVVERLAEQDPPRTDLLSDEHVIFLVAFDGDEPIGFAFGYELPRRHGNANELFVYELGVDEPYRRRGIAKRLMHELLAGRDGSFVITEPENDAANATYRSLGGKRSETVLWEW